MTSDINIDTIKIIATVAAIVAKMRKDPSGIRFADFCKVCDAYRYQVRQVLNAIEKWEERYAQK